MAEETPKKKPAARKKKEAKTLPLNPGDLARQLRDAARTENLTPKMRQTLMETANAVVDADDEAFLKQISDYITGGSLQEDLKVNTKPTGTPAAPAKTETPATPEKKTPDAPAAAPAAKAEEAPAPAPAPAPVAETPKKKIVTPKARKPEAPKNATAGAEAAPRKPLTVGRLASPTPTEATAPATPPPTPPPTPPAAPATASTPPPTTAPAAAAAEAKQAKGILSRLGAMRNSKMGMLGLAGLAALAGGSIYRATQMPQDRSKAEEALAEAETRSRSAKIAKLLEQARMERTLAENQRRLAQSNPDLYTSVMAGRRVPAGSVVLGGRPRMDLMQELAASMDSGRYARPDPLSELMG